MSNVRQSEILKLIIQLPGILREQMLLHMAGTSKLCSIEIHIQNYADKSITHADKCFCLEIDHEPELLIKQSFRDTLEIDSLKKQLENAILEIEELKSRLGRVSNAPDSKANSTFSDTAAQSPMSLAQRKKSGR